MKWSRFIISALLLLIAVDAAASDSIQVEQVEETGYDKRMHRYREHWQALIPKQFVIQNAGNMGTLSAGFGWNYGRHGKWETHLLFGFIPKHKSDRAKMTMTIKENFIPWSIDLKKGWSFKPLSSSIYVNTVFGSEFWKSQPDRYPDGYYFMSTKFHLNVALGQQITFDVPYEKRKGSKSITLFYEISTCDLYIRSKFLDHSVPWKDILGLSIGLKWQTL